MGLNVCIYVLRIVALFTSAVRIVPIPNTMIIIVIIDWQWGRNFVQTRSYNLHKKRSLAVLWVADISTIVAIEEDYTTVVKMLATKVLRLNFGLKSRNFAMNSTSQLQERIAVSCWCAANEVPYLFQTQCAAVLRTSTPVHGEQEMDTQKRKNAAVKWQIQQMHYC